MVEIVVDRFDYKMEQTEEGGYVLYEDYETLVKKFDAFHELDLTKGEEHDHPDISPDKQYLVKVHSGWFFGSFTKQWYGWSFSNWGTSGIQYDKPGFNSSTWERIIEIDPEKLFQR